MSKLFRQLPSMGKQRFLVMTIVVALAFVSNTHAQENNPTFLVLEIEGLTPYNYGDIAREFLNDADVSIERACVPAGLILFKQVNPETGLAYIRSKINGATSDLGNVAPSELNASGFDNRCMEVRSGSAQ